MSESIPAAASTPAPASGLVNRFAGILVSPRETFAEVVARPRWVGMLVLATLLTSSAWMAFMSTKAGQDAWLDQAVRGSERWGRKMDDRAYARMEKMASMAPLMFGVPVLISIPVMTFVMSGVLFGVMKALTGSGASFPQTLSVVVHGSPVSLVHLIVMLPLNYLRGSLSGSTSLGVFLPMLEEGSFGAALAGKVDFFIIWWIVVLAVGLSVLYKRPTRPIVFGLLGLYAVIAVVTAAVFGG